MAIKTPYFFSKSTNPLTNSCKKKKLQEQEFLPIWAEGNWRVDPNKFKEREREILKDEKKNGEKWMFSSIGRNQF